MYLLLELQLGVTIHAAQPNQAYDVSAISTVSSWGVSRANLSKQSVK